MNPLVRMRLRHPQALAWPFWDGMLFPIGQHQAQRVGHRGEGRAVIRTVATVRPRLSITGVVCQVSQEGAFEMRQQCREGLGGSAGHGPYTPGPLRHLVIAGHRHLHHWGMSRWARILYKP
jgi:hypothetical protein